MAEYEISHPRIPQINGTILEGPEGLPPPSEADLWSAIKQKVRPLGLSNLTDEEKIIAYRNGVFDPPEIPDDSDQPGMIEGLIDLGGKAVLRGGQMLNFDKDFSKIGFSGPYDKIMRLEEEAVPYEKVENVDQFRDAGKRLFGLLDNKEDLADLGDPIGDALRQAGMPFFANNPNARGRVKTAAMDYAQSSLVAGMGEGYVRAASGGEFLYKGGKYLKDKVLLDESDDQDVLDFVNSAIQFDSLNHRYENSAELAAFVLENPQESFKALASEKLSWRCDQ